MSIAEISLYLASPLVLLVLVIIFVQRRLTREFPIFFAYMLYVPVTALLRVSVVHHPKMQFWLYWSTEAIYGVFALMVLSEVLGRLFSLAHEADRWLRWVLPIGVVLVLGFVLLQTIYRPLIDGRVSHLRASIYWFDVGVHLLEGSILIFVLVLRSRFPVLWKRRELGILVGFAINAAIAITAFVLRFELGKQYEAFFRYSQALAYLMATLIWLVAFLGPPEPNHRSRGSVDEMLDEVKEGKGFLKWIERGLGLRRCISDLPSFASLVKNV